MTPQIIGLVGKKTSGKDTVYGYIRELLETPSYLVIRHAFADSLKQEIAEACGVSLEYIEQHKTVFRTILQWWGTEFRRGLFCDSYWIDRVRMKITASDADVIVITDVRFHNEANMVREMGGKIVGISRIRTDVADHHSSEVEQETIPCDAIIHNDGTLEELRDKTRETLLKILPPITK